MTDTQMHKAILARHGQQLHRCSLCGTPVRVSSSCFPLRALVTRHCHTATHLDPSPSFRLALQIKLKAVNYLLLGWKLVEFSVMKNGGCGARLI